MAKHDHPTPPLIIRLVHIKVYEGEDVPVVGVKCDIWQDGVVYWNVTQPDGIAIINVPVSNSLSRLDVYGEGYNKYVGNYSLPSAEVHLPIKLTRVPIIVVPIIPPAGELSIDGIFFKTKGIARRIQGATAFTLMKDIIDGKDMSPFLKVLRELNVNTVRALGCMFNIARFIPREIPGYSDQLGKIADYLRDQGFFFEFTLADCQLTFDSVHELYDFVGVTSNGLAIKKNVLFNTNEPYKNLPPGVTPFDLSSHINGMCLWDQGAGPNPNDNDPATKDDYIPHGKFITRHPPRSSKLYTDGDYWPRYAKEIVDVRGTYHVPCYDDEPYGAALVDSGSRDVNPLNHKRFHGIAALYGSSAMHGTSLITCTIPTGIELECYRAIAKSWGFIPERAITGQYTRFGDGHPITPPLINNTGYQDARCYFSILGNEAWAVMLDDRQVPVAQDGWSIKEIDGPLVSLTR